MPEYLPAVPRDPFTQGEEMKYDAARGIIWTVGQNGTFNGETGFRMGGPAKYAARLMEFRTKRRAP